MIASSGPTCLNLCKAETTAGGKVFHSSTLTECFLIIEPFSQVPRANPLLWRGPVINAALSYQIASQGLSSSICVTPLSPALHRCTDFLCPGGEASLFAASILGVPFGLIGWLKSFDMTPPNIFLHQKSFVLLIGVYTYIFLVLIQSHDFTPVLLEKKKIGF